MKKDRAVIPLSGEIEIIVHDKNGKVIHREKRPMDSFVSNMTFYLRMLDIGAWMAKDVAGNNIQFNLEGHQADNILYDADITAPEGWDSYGIVVGSSNEDFDVTQYKLGSQIYHGDSAGQLYYNACEVDSAYNDHITWIRTFDNRSGDDIIVREIGIIAKVTRNEGGTPQDYFILLARDVISATTVPNNGRLTVKYTFRINA